MGEVWVRAPKYYEKSTFTIKTDGQAATVRGTVFGLMKTLAGSHIRLADGSIAVKPDDPTHTSLYSGIDGAGFELDDVTRELVMKVPE